MYSGTPLIWTLVIGIDLALPGKFIEYSTQLTCLEITDYLIKYKTVFWLL
jgi:hypothetical protein